MKEYKRFHSAIEEVYKEDLLSWYVYRGVAIGGFMGVSMGAAIGGVTGSALGPVGTIAGVGAGVTYGWGFGGILGAIAGGITGLFYGANNDEQKDRCKKLIDSCVKELEENTHKLQAIQDQLNEAEKSF